MRGEQVVRFWCVAAIVGLAAVVSASDVGLGEGGAATGPTVVRLEDVGSNRVEAVPQGVPISQIRTSPSGGQVVSGGVNRTVIYSNTTGGQFRFKPGAGALIADDLFTTVLGSCDLIGYEILVSGGGDGSPGTPGYDVELALYDGCPDPDVGGQIIPGTEATVTVDNNGPTLVTVDLAGAEVAIPSSLWLGVRFSTNSGGWITGTVAQLGFTNDVYFFDNPNAAGCESRFGGTGLHAGFYAALSCTGDFQTQFLAYLNSTPGNVITGGAGVTILDDVDLVVDQCTLTGYEVGLIGSMPFNADLELWFDCDESTAILGTDTTFAGVGDGTIEIASAIYPDGVVLPSGRFWVAITTDTGSSGPVISGEPFFGESQDLYALWDQAGSPGECSFFFFGGNPLAAFYINIFCAGAPPMGACCPSPTPDAGPFCRISSEFNCDGRWIENAVCDPDPFTPPCGIAACCTPADVCENLTKIECDAVGGSWQSSAFCDEGGQSCPFFACLTGEGDCCVAKETRGCDRQVCCATVCEVDDWCCTVQWDNICAEESLALCNTSCVAGSVTWSDPPDGVVDARQPYLPGDPSTRQGITEITVTDGPTNADRACCWSLCELPHAGPDNEIVAVVSNGGGSYTVELARPLTPGMATTITYLGSDTTGTFVAHPGDVDGSGSVGPGDFITMIDCIHDLNACPFGTMSCDMDRDETCGPSDVLRLIEIMTGANSFEPWLGTSRTPAAPECQPIVIP